jgi:glycine C-acetyltransferase
MFGSFQSHLQTQLAEIRAAGLYKAERVITSPQDARIRVADGREVLNMCANNYLGLAEHPEVVAAAQAAMGQWG